MAKNAFATIGILAVLLLSLGLVSALAIEVENVSAPTDIDEDAGSFDFTFNINYTGASENATINFEDSITSPFGSVTIANETGVNGTASEVRTITGTVSNFADQGGNSLTVYINASGPFSARNEDINFTVTINNVIPPIEIDTLCELEGFDEDGDLEISDFDVINNGDGSDDEWKYLDELEIVVEIGNTDSNDDINDVEVMIVIFDNVIDAGGIDVTNEFDLDDEVLTSIGKLRDKDEETVTFLIDELSADVDEGTYYMYIMAYSDGNEDEQCESVSNKLDDDNYFEFRVEAVDYDESVVARGSGFENQMDTYCGQERLEITVPIYNLGDGDEERVLVNIRDSELGVNEYIVIKNLDSGDRETISFFIDIPSDLSRESYDLDVYVYFDWDDEEDDDAITSYDEQTADASVRLNILGCTGADPTISASLDSEAKVGEELVILATITNNGNDESFEITLSGYESWAELVSISPDTFSLDEDEDRTVTITLIPTEEGIQTFDVNVISEDDSYDQAVSVNISKEKGLFEDVNKSVFYSAIGIVALLVLIFLTLIVKISRRSKRAAPQF